MLNSSSTSFNIQVYHSSEEKSYQKTIALEKKLKKMLEKEKENLKKKGFTIEFQINLK
jgi:hypothetical protein